MSYEILDKINLPGDLRLLSTQELNKLAGELNDFITQTVSRTGGHLASNLGVVELTIAMHYVFDFQHGQTLCGTWVINAMRTRYLPAEKSCLRNCGRRTA